jgi:hypothetical protein
VAACFKSASVVNRLPARHFSMGPKRYKLALCWDCRKDGAKHPSRSSVSVQMSGWPYRVW